MLYVHGSPQRHLRGYVFPEDIYSERKMTEIGTQFDRVCFTGGTGVPGLFVERQPACWDFFGPEDCVSGFQITGQRVLCNVGAIGYPRDGDWRACFVLFDGETIRFRRVEYDVETRIRKIQAIPMRGNSYWERLREGRA